MLASSGFVIVAGSDEAGRGALAGPIVAAAVVLRRRNNIDGLKDSKKLSPSAREILYGHIVKKSKAWATGIVTASEIDERGIQHANLKAMEEAVKRLSIIPDCVIADWYENPGYYLPWLGIARGEDSHPSIAAASIVAKVTRDRIMRELAEEYPRYGFAAHKGYGTSSHIAAIKEFGLSDEHRMSFEPCRSLVR